jgi:hypothetical protein
MEVSSFTLYLPVPTDLTHSCTCKLFANKIFGHNIVVSLIIELILLNIARIHAPILEIGIAVIAWFIAAEYYNHPEHIEPYTYVSLYYVFFFFVLATFARSSFDIV